MPPLTLPAELADIVARFEDCTLTHAEWNHRAHVAVAVRFVAERGPQAAMERLRAGIRRLNACHGVVETPTRGYHETITRFWAETVARRLAETDPALPPAERAAAVIAACSDKGLILRHYSRELLASPSARYGWVEPDLVPPNGGETSGSGPVGR
jgi:hypothetical protein